MTTGGTATASYEGIGKGGAAETYIKQWDLQPVTDVDVPTEIATLISNARGLAESYQYVTKGLLLGCSLAFDVSVTPIAAEANAYKNRAAAIQGTIDGNPAKKFVAYVQAARAGIFVGDSEAATVVDVADADVVAYFGTLNGTALVSDGEVPHQTPISGYRIDRKNSTKD